LPDSNGNTTENLATAVTEVSERVTILVREEIELAKAEVAVKVRRFSRGVIAGAIGAVLALLAIPFALLTLAWGLNAALNSLWLGFLIVLLVLLVCMAVAFLYAWRKMQAGPPAPTMAIEEAKKIRETVAVNDPRNVGG
jgi:hypothetical protein